MLTTHRTVAIKILNRLSIILFGVIVFNACNPKVSYIEDYNDAFQSMKNAEIIHTDSGKLQMVLWGQEILFFDDEEETQEFPNGVKATFYNELGEVSVTITADEGTSYRKKNLMNLRKNVVIRHHQDKKTTYTEDFYWDRNKHIIYSDVYVLQIGDNGDRTEGTGFDSDEEMNNFNIRNPRFSYTF